MTLAEFDEQVIDFYELDSFCQENDLDFCIDIYDSYEVNQEIDCDAKYLIDDEGWEYAREVLNGMDFPTGYDHYRKESYFEWTALGDDDFNELLQEVRIYCIDNEFFEDAYADEEYENCWITPAKGEDNEPDTDITPDFSTEELIGLCSMDYIKEQNKRAEDREAQQREFINFVQDNFLLTF